MNVDDKIRAILRAEADAVDPSAAGWDAIRTGVAARRSRVWWTRGTALAGVTAVLAGVMVYVAADRTPRGIEAPPATSGSSVSASPVESPVPTPASGFAAEPIGAIWPLTTQGELAAWNADHGTYPALETASGSALAFARRYLGLPDATVSVLPGSPHDGAFAVRDGAFSVSNVTVRSFAEDGGAPFLVTRAASSAVTITEPDVDGAVAGVVTARGAYTFVEPIIDVTLRADGSGSAPVDLATKRAETGPDGWRADLAFTTTATTGSLLVTIANNRDGATPAAAAAIPVRFGATKGPKVFVAARDGRIGVISASTGTVVRWLTEALPGGGASDPELADDGKTVVYAQGSGTCASEIRSVPVTGGAPTTLVPAGSGALSHPSRRRGVLAYVRTLCQSGGDRQEVVVDGTGQPTTYPVDGVVRGGPVTGERFVAYVTAKGAENLLHLPDALGELGDTPVGSPDGCAWGAPSWGARDGNGRERVFAAATCAGEQDVARTRIYRLDADGLTTEHWGTVRVTGVRSLDWAGEYLVLGTGGDKPQAWTYHGGDLTAVPGSAQRPTWS